MKLIFKSINKGNVKEFFESVKSFEKLDEVGLAYDYDVEDFFLAPSSPNHDLVLFSLGKYVKAGGEVDYEKFFSDFYCECYKMKIHLGEAV